MPLKKKKKKVLCVVFIAISFYPMVSIASGGNTSSTGIQAPSESHTVNGAQQTWDVIQKTISTIQGVVGGITAIFLFQARVYKPIREWLIRKTRNMLKIVEIDKKFDEKFASVEQNANEHAETQRKEYAIITGQNTAIENTLVAVLQSVEQVNEKLKNIEDGQRAVLKDAITKTFYKYVKRQAIPIHEKENVTKMYEIYVNMNGNSYVDSIMKAMDKWEVLSGEDAPSHKLKQYSKDDPGY